MIDVDQLFEKHNVSEIDGINTKLKHEIEKKREELRTMVGERYRDLLKAADTINNMKHTSQEVIQSIEAVTGKCRMINDQQLIGFKEAPVPPRNAKAGMYSVCAQVKLLSMLPELIWTHLDNDEYFLATQLFIFARHINTGLRLNSDAAVLTERFPVIKNQWAILSQFFGTIQRKCLERLEMEDLTPEIASKCLAGLVLLDCSDLETVLKTLIRLRTKGFVEILTDKGGKFSGAKDKLLASLSVLNNTVLLVYKCFIDSGLSGTGYVLRELQQLSADTSPYSISLMELENETSIQYLPDIITKYRPNVTFNATLSPSSLQQVMSDWLNQLDRISGTEIKSLVNLIVSVKVIRDIKHNSYDQEKIPNWTEICDGLQFTTKVDFYKQFYQNLINDRVKEIIQSNWDENLKQVTAEIHDFLSSEAPHQTMAKFTWTEELTDIPKSLDQALDKDKKKQKLLMKSLGFVPEIVRICGHFDGNLEVLYLDIDNYITKESSTNAQFRMKKEIESDKQDLIDFLIESSQNGINHLITSLRSETVSNAGGENLVRMARLYQAITELCPYLKLCLSYNISSVNLSRNNWDRVSQLLHEESLSFWRRWSDEYFTVWTSTNRAELTQTVDSAKILHGCGSWESVAIEETDEQENAVQSTIRIPSQPSFPLQSTLFLLATDLNKVVPHTMPTVVIQQLLERVTAELLSVYQELNENDFIKANQNISLQYYFDVKYVSGLLISRETVNKSLAETAQTLANTLKSQVDPFDFELFFAYLTKNIKRAVQRSLSQLGVIVPNMELMLTILGASGPDLKFQEKDPNVLSLSDNSAVTWFPLLPIANPTAQSSAKHDESHASVQQQQPTARFGDSSSRGRLADRHQHQQQHHHQSPSLLSSSSSSSAQNYVKSGAAAFFGAIFQGQ